MGKCGSKPAGGQRREERYVLDRKNSGARAEAPAPAIGKDSPDPASLALFQSNLAHLFDGCQFCTESPAPEYGTKPWTKLAPEYIAEDDIESAMRMLHCTLGIVDFGPLKQAFVDIHTAARRDASHVLTTHLSLDGMSSKLKRAYDDVTAGKFADALKLFNEILVSIPLVVVDTCKEVDDVKELMNICKEYVTALKCEMLRKDTRDDPKRSAELAAYFTHCSLKPLHEVLSLRSALSIFYKLKNYATCATFCRRLLELNPPDKVAAQARQVLAVCEKAPKDAVELNYDARNPFDICALTFTPIYKGSACVQCPMTGARFQTSCNGQVSPFGGIARIGADASGLVVSPTQVR